jgi:hypothetical protein
MHNPWRKSEIGKAGGQRRRVERQMHGVTCLRVRQRELEHLARRQTDAGSAKRDAGGRIAAQVAPVVGNDRVLHG